jgi:hypothetical protein
VPLAARRLLSNGSESGPFLRVAFSGANQKSVEEVLILQLSYGWDPDGVLGIS